MLWNLTRICPYCGSSDVYRSRRYDKFEKMVLPLLLQGPFRCLNCHERHYNFVFSKKIEIETSEQESSRSK
jgi:hypothetical protein